MSVWDKYECEGQLSLFDFMDIPKEETNLDRQRKIEDEVVDRILNWTIRYKSGWSKLPREERIQVAKEANNNSGGGRSDYIWSCNLKGIDITFDKPIGKCLAVHIGWPMFDNRVFGRDKKIECKYSGHTCNRDELWEIAESLEVGCIKQCCRKCKVRLCGARCNGSEEPAKTVEVDVRGFCDDGYCPICNYALDDLVEQCPECKTYLSWNHWRIVNAEYIKNR